MNNLHKLPRSLKLLMPPLLLCAFLYLTMCPFAQSLLINDGQQALLLPKQPPSKCEALQEHLSPHPPQKLPVHPAILFHKKTVLRTAIRLHRETPISLAAICTSRLII